MHSRNEEGAENATINREYTMLNKAFNLAMKSWGWVKDNPCSSISKYPENNKRDRWLTWEEEDALLNASESYLRGALKRIIILALNTGMWKDETLDLKWEQVDFESRCIVIQETKTKGPRTVPINNTMLKMLSERYEKTSETRLGYVFSTKNGMRIGTRKMLREFYKALRKARIENFRFHDLRHTFATRLVQAGDQLLRVSQLLGHRQVTTTQRYAHQYLESLRPSVMFVENLRISRLREPIYLEKVDSIVSKKR